MADPKRPRVEIAHPLTLVELCRLGGFEAAWAVELVDHGVIAPEAEESGRWRFAPADASIAIRAWRLHCDLGVNAPGAALALSLIRERDRLRRRIARLVDG